MSESQQQSTQDQAPATDAAPSPAESKTTETTETGGEKQPEYKLSEDLLGKDGQPDLAKIIGRMSSYEAERAARGEPPEAPDGYTFEVPKDLKLPDGTPAEIDADSEIYKRFRETAHELGLPQAEAQKIFDLGVEMQFGILAQARADAQAALTAEKAKLGSKADQRIQNIGNWMASLGGREAANTLLEGFNSADQVVALEKIIAKLGGAGAAGASKTGAAAGKPADDFERLYPSMAR